MTYRVGQKLDRPPEPPVGTVLRSTGPDGSFTIERDRKGWRITGTHTRVGWRSVLSAWGPGQDGVTLTVVKLP